MEVYVDDPPNVPDLEDLMRLSLEAWWQDVLQHLSQLDYQAYCTIFAINGGPESFRKPLWLSRAQGMACRRVSRFMGQASDALDVCVRDFAALAKAVS